MTIQTAGYFIFGITTQGNKFRPSDWVERIASAFGRFDQSQRLHYSPLVMPAKFDNQSCLFVAASLEKLDPAGYNFIIDFAQNNHLVIKTNARSGVPLSASELQYVA